VLAMTPARCGQNASTTPANASTAPARPLKANSAIMLVQHWQQGQLDAGNDASAMRARTPAQRHKNAIAALARPSKAKSLWADARYSNKATGNDVEHNNNALPTMCVMTGQMPVCDAGGNAGVPRWQRQHDIGKDTRTTRGMMPVLRWQRQQRDAGDDASKCRNCFVTGQTPVCDAGSNAKATRATMPARRGQKCPCNKGNDVGATASTMTAQCW
jgi:hypothetical protein